MHPFNESPEFTDDILIGQSAFCLRVPYATGEELVVHREDGNDYVFLFESLDDAYDCALQAGEALAFTPLVRLIDVRDLNFPSARFKPADGAPVDIALPPRR